MGDDNNNLRLLPPRKELMPDEQPHIVGILSELLELAKAGRIAEIYVVTWATGGGTEFRRSHITNIIQASRMIGLLEIAKQTLVGVALSFRSG